MHYSIEGGRIQGEGGSCQHLFSFCSQVVTVLLQKQLADFHQKSVLLLEHLNEVLGFRREGTASDVDGVGITLYRDLRPRDRASFLHAAAGICMGTGHGKTSVSAYSVPVYAFSKGDVPEEARPLLNLGKGDDHSSPRYFFLVAIPPRIWRWALFSSKIAFT